MDAILAQGRITLRATAPAVVSITQDEWEWMNLGSYADAAFWIDVSDLTQPASGGSVSLVIESAPMPDEALFQPIAGPVPLAVSALPLVVKSVRGVSTVPLSRWVRLRVSVPDGASGSWSVTCRVRAVPGKSSFWLPTDIAGLLGWYRADLGVTKDVSTGAVSAWVDQSGNGNSLTQGVGSGKQPIWTGSSINRYPSIDFDGADDLLSASLSLATYTILMVATGQTSTAGFFWFHGTSGVAHDTLYGSLNSTVYVDRGGTASGWTLAADWGKWNPPDARLLTVRFDGTHAGHTLRINALDQTMTPTLTGDPGTNPQSALFCVGARDDAVLPAATKVAELIIYDRVLSSAELATVEEYLRRRYALY